MSEFELSYEELLQIIKIFESSSEFNDLHLQYGDIELNLRKRGAAPDSAVAQAIAENVAVPIARARSSPSSERQAPLKIEAAPSAPMPQAASSGEFPSSACIVKSPMVGIFYCAPEPGAQPFVEIGQRVTADTTACIIEVMKLMSSIQTGAAGVVTHVLVKDGEAVEFGQALVVIQPSD